MAFFDQRPTQAPTSQVPALFLYLQLMMIAPQGFAGRSRASSRIGGYPVGECGQAGGKGGHQPRPNHRPLSPLSLACPHGPAGAPTGYPRIRAALPSAHLPKPPQGANKPHASLCSDTREATRSDDRTDGRGATRGTDGREDGRGRLLISSCISRRKGEKGPEGDPPEGQENPGPKGQKEAPQALAALRGPTGIR